MIIRMITRLGKTNEELQVKNVENYIGQHVKIFKGIDVENFTFKDVENFKGGHVEIFKGIDVKNFTFKDVETFKGRHMEDFKGIKVSLIVEGDVVVLDTVVRGLPGLCVVLRNVYSPNLQGLEKKRKVG